jgi:hypothetical protein
MFNDDWYHDKMKEIADSEEKRIQEYKNNPLSQYSTSQLKAELRRRKNQ